jgi:molybdate transport system regulatory protein
MLLLSIGKDAVQVRFRIDLTEHCSIGPGKIELLEAIEKLGSLRKAAIELGMSYRRGWLLINNLNHSFQKPLTSATVGGLGGGGIELTAFGLELVRRYRAAGRRIDTLARSKFADFVRNAAPDYQNPPSSERRSLKRRI